ncbi:hypothetical protein ACQEVZ_23830 [Dactylosporangium sp. CA-152071]|uniref:hypothetical protein n=1 Tax=Dactylosporangium sp. CA-152071 TaxID=3239933 RepID=UPI003D8C1BE0
MAIEHAPLYVAARRVLLDALDALAGHRSAVVLAGAQAIYARTGAAEIDASVAPFTSDADLALDPRLLGPDPRIDEAMTAAGFRLCGEPGIWVTQTLMGDATVEIPVDLLVPASLAGPGRRSARLPEHGRNAARRTPGLEAAVADHGVLEIASLEPHVDQRVRAVSVAGVPALFVAKAQKIAERLADARCGRPERLKPKDASDVIRLMQGAPPDMVGDRLGAIAHDPVAGASVREGVEHLRRLFGRRRSPGVDLAVAALTGAMPELSVRELAVSYVGVLLEAYSTQAPERMTRVT